MSTQRHAERAVEAHADALATFPNVVGVGTREHRDAERRRPVRSHAVAVYVSEKKPTSELAPDEVLPGFVEIDDQGATVKVPVDVVEAGAIHPERDGGGAAENRRSDGDDGSTFSPQ